MKADAVFEGGGVKGIAFIGAIAEMEAHGYNEWGKLAGTSAGSIVATLLAVGYKSDEIYLFFQKIKYMQFLQRTGIGQLPYIGSIYQLLKGNGLYSGERMEAFFTELLAAKGVHRFGDMPEGKLRIIASDISAGKMLILPEDLAEFDIDPSTFSVAQALRLSCSIPYFFQPPILYREKQPHTIVDGGLLSNFPVWLFDSITSPRWPTFGFRLSGSMLEPRYTPITGLLSYSRSLVATMLEAHDRAAVKKTEAVRTVFIPTLGVRTTDFDLEQEKQKALYESGRQAAQDFLARWDFEVYKREYRQ